MTTSAAFAVWITGLPSSGKSTIAGELGRQLRALGVVPVTLESDVLRRILTPEATYSAEERDRFYLQFAEIGALIVRDGIPVIFDATANRRIYRDRARGLIPRFIEVAVTTPLELCLERDAKGIYAAAHSGRAVSVPGMQTVYEAPLAPEAAVDGSVPPAESARRIIHALRERAFLPYKEFFPPY